MDKLIVIPKYFANTYEPSVQVLDLDRPNEKIASEAWEYIKDVKPEKGKRFILVIAMGAGEFYSSNRNGDFFVEHDLVLDHKNFETGFDAEGKINSGALIYKHHKNKLHKGHPWFGVVKKSFYNDKMHRVELLLEFHESKDPGLIERIDNGETLKVSMGCRIPYDQCSICGNKAKKREEYCDHLRYEMNKILPDGRKIFAINGQYDRTKHKKGLNFFDISVVFRPADELGYQLKKVAEMEDADITSSAELFEKESALKEKIAMLRKLSTIDKVIRGIPVAEKDETGEIKAIKNHPDMVKKIISGMEPLSYEQIDSLSSHPMNKILSTLASHNIILTTPEFVSLLVKKVTGKHLPVETLKTFCAHQAEIFEEAANDPELVEEVSGFDMFKDVEPDSEISKIVEPVREKRDLSDKGLEKKASVDILRSALDLKDAQFGGDNKGMLHTETITDPQTGKQYSVNMDAIEDARYWTDISEGMKGLRNFALMAGAAAALAASKNQTAQALSKLSLVGALGLGLYGLKNAIFKTDPSIYTTTQEGTQVPKSAVLFEKKSAINDSIQKLIAKSRVPLGLVAPVATVPFMSKYYEDRLKKGVAGVHTTDTEKSLDELGRAAYVHPVVTGAAGVAGVNLGLTGLDKLRSLIFESGRKFRR